MGRVWFGSHNSWSGRERKESRTLSSSLVTMFPVLSDCRNRIRKKWGRNERQLHGLDCIECIWRDRTWKYHLKPRNRGREGGFEMFKRKEGNKVPERRKFLDVDSGRSIGTTERSAFSFHWHQEQSSPPTFLARKIRNRGEESTLTKTRRDEGERTEGNKSSDVKDCELFSYNFLHLTFSFLFLSTANANWLLSLITPFESPSLHINLVNLITEILTEGEMCFSYRKHSSPHLKSKESGLLWFPLFPLFLVSGCPSLPPSSLARLSWYNSPEGFKVQASPHFKLTQPGLPKHVMSCTNFSKLVFES